jgi:hypothetical protein
MNGLWFCAYNPALSEIGPLLLQDWGTKLTAQDLRNMCAAGIELLAKQDRVQSITHHTAWARCHRSCPMRQASLTPLGWSPATPLADAAGEPDTPRVVTGHPAGVGP